MAQPVISGWHPVTEIITAQPSDTDYTTAVIDTRDYSTVWFEVALDDASAPSGVLYVYGGLRNNITTLRPLTLTEGDLSAEAGVALSNGAVAVTGGSLTADAVIQIACNGAPPYMALFWDRSGGGTTGDRLNAWWFGRGM